MRAAERRKWVFGGTGLAAALLFLLLGWESDWGQSLHGDLVAPVAPDPKPVSLALLQDIAPQGGPSAYTEITARPLLTPTRQPAPPAPAPEARPSMPKGQLVLMGTLLAGGKNYALLRETNGTKQTRVAQGDTIKGLVVDKVEPTQVVLRLGEETELLSLKTYIPPRAAGSAGSGVRPATPAPAAPITTQQASAPSSAAAGMASQAPPQPPPAQGGERPKFRAAAPEGSDDGRGPIIVNRPRRRTE